jgi:ABC-type bacteriocin/lantibiotic exporter with double-glycine peptidase domain
MSIFAALIMLYEPLKSLSKASASLHEAAAGWHRLELAFDCLVDEQCGAPDKVVPGSLTHGVSLRRVRLCRGEQWVLDGVDLELAVDSCVVLFGASGAGKSSLLKLLAGLLSADAGELCWDGQPFSSLDPDVLARRIGYLDQEASCVGRSIRANLSQGEVVEEHRLVDALQRARAWDWVQGRGGLDAVLEESAQDLSGGQRRRLALARALVQSPSLLLLDEPTDAVDPQTERALLAELEALKGSTTLVLVVHQPEAVAWADKYYCLQDGHLLERAGAGLQSSE